MSTIEIILPAAQLEGTSATLSKWLVKIGQQVHEGDPIIELETDKVSMEICAPHAGCLSKIIANEGEDISVDVVLGLIDSNAVSNSSENTPDNALISEQTTECNSTGETEATVDQAQEEQRKDDSDRNLIGPAVRRLLTANQLDINHISGSGRRGRITRDDVNAYLADVQSGKIPVSKVAVKKPAHPFAADLPAARPLNGTMVPHTNMRKAIATHMVESLLNTSPHVTSVFEMELTNVIEHRKWHKKEFAELDVKLTFTAYFLAAVVKAAQAVPQVNARFHQDALELFTDINIGVGTALGDDGLVVPVVQQVQSMNLFSIAKALNAQTEKARTGKLTPADMKNGTFTISNHGISGSLFATPIIINQPQVAILGIGKLEKRVVVEEVDGTDTMVIKPKCYVSLSIDHRALDAHQTNKFLTEFVEVIETWGE